MANDGGILIVMHQYKVKNRSTIVVKISVEEKLILLAEQCVLLFVKSTICDPVTFACY